MSYYKLMIKRKWKSAQIRILKTKNTKTRTWRRNITKSNHNLEKDKST